MDTITQMGSSVYAGQYEPLKPLAFRMWNLAIWEEKSLFFMPSNCVYPGNTLKLALYILLIVLSFTYSILEHIQFPVPYVSVHSQNIHPVIQV